MRPKAFFLWNGQEIIALKINISSWVKKNHLRNVFKMWIPVSYPRDLRQEFTFPAPGIHILAGIPRDSGAEPYFEKI